VIARVAVSPLGLRELSGDRTLSPWDVLRRHKDLIDVLEIHAILVLASEA
jgi:hypothetical protein